MAERIGRDEHYIIDLCDLVLGQKAERQRKFPFLQGDADAKGRRVLLAVDAYYPELNLVIEYCERQHTEPVALFDGRMTLSGVHRNEQRRIYDRRRRMVLPQHGITLVELSYLDFAYDGRKRLRRNPTDDERVVRQKLALVAV